MLPKPQFGRYNDGVAEVYASTDARLVPGVDFSGTEGLSEVAALAFGSVMLRESDVELASAQGFELTRKVRTRQCPGFDAGCCVLVGGTLYEVPWLERTADGREAYALLSELATDGTVDLQDRAAGHDANGNPSTTWVTAVTAHCRKCTPSQQRSTGAGADVRKPSITVRLRACDYGAGHARLVRDGVPYTVASAKGAGEWVDVVATREGGDL